MDNQTKYQDWSSRLQAVTAGPVRRTDLLVWTVIGLGILGLSIVFNGFGVLHFELAHYIPYHLGPGSIWKKIFDYRILDSGIYEGREFSYLVDHCDVLLVALTAKWGFPLFVSATHVLLCVYIGVWIGWFAARDLRLGSLIGLLVALLFWTTPFVYLHYLLRTAKVLTAAALVTLIAELYRALAERAGGRADKLSFRFGASLTVSAWVLSFSDRQGFFFLAGACLLVGLQWGVNKDRLAGRILCLLLAVLVLELAYFFWIAPALTRTFCGYPTDFSYNQLPLGELLARWGYFATQALALLTDTCGLVLARMPRWAVVLFVGAGLAGALDRDIRERSWRDRIPFAGVALATLVALWAMFVLMILRHPPVLWPDIQLVYYWLPTGALLVLGIACAMRGWAQSLPGRKAALAGLLLAVVLGNVAALPGHWRVFEAGHLRDYIKSTHELRDALIHRDAPPYTASPAVSEIAAFPVLLDYALRSEPLPVRRDAVTSRVLRHRANPGRELPAVSDAPVAFIDRLGGNVDSRYLSTTAEFLETADRRSFLGGTAGSMEMRVNLTTNRLRGEVILRRTEAGVDRPLFADFAIYAQPDPSTRSERWSARVRLLPGQKEVVVPYAIDSSHWPTVFTLDISEGNAGKLAAGWGNPYITDAGGDSAEPAWLGAAAGPVTVLDEAALAKLLPDSWRPLQAQLRHGTVTANGIELRPGGEIWLHVRGIVSKFTGIASTVSGTDSAAAGAPVVRGCWYKAGRLQLYAPPAPESGGGPPGSFQAWCAEPGGWLVIMAGPNQDGPAVAIRVNEVRQSD